ITSAPSLATISTSPDRPVCSSSGLGMRMPWELPIGTMRVFMRASKCLPCSYSAAGGQPDREDRRREKEAENSFFSSLQRGSFRQTCLDRAERCQVLLVLMVLPQPCLVGCRVLGADECVRSPSRLCLQIQVAVSAPDDVFQV